ncbi:hypothetical protein EYF80_024519 [Liparis tanakae]|uniref:Uncharacterized protein n=1 Tax=Liparis tanakae TaxID=230148 RepID=A0A4Z2HI77_9TELE|nr:hypothetical protein EYF80_024519 [Liparis tanakae]
MSKQKSFAKSPILPDAAPRDLGSHCEPPADEQLDPQDLNPFSFRQFLRSKNQDQDPEQDLSQVVQLQSAAEEEDEDEGGHDMSLTFDPEEEAEDRWGRSLKSGVASMSFFCTEEEETRTSREEEQQGKEQQGKEQQGKQQEVQKKEKQEEQLDVTRPPLLEQSSPAAGARSSSPLVQTVRNKKEPAETEMIAPVEVLRDRRVKERDRQVRQTDRQTDRLDLRSRDLHEDHDILQPAADDDLLLFTSGCLIQRSSVKRPRLKQLHLLRSKATSFTKQPAGGEHIASDLNFGPVNPVQVNSVQGYPAQWLFVGIQVLPEGVEEPGSSAPNLLQSVVNCLSEGGLTALGVFDMLIQTVLQGGAHRLQPADRPTLTKGPTGLRADLKPVVTDVVLHVGQTPADLLLLAAQGALQLLQLHPAGGQRTRDLHLLFVALRGVQSRLQSLLTALLTQCTQLVVQVHLLALTTQQQNIMGDTHLCVVEAVLKVQPEERLLLQVLLLEEQQQAGGAATVRQERMVQHLRHGQR